MAAFTRIAASLLAAASVTAVAAAPAGAAETVHLFGVERISQLAHDERVGLLAQLGTDRSGQRAVVVRSFARSDGFAAGDDRRVALDPALDPVDVLLTDAFGGPALTVLMGDGSVRFLRLAVQDGQVVPVGESELRLAGVTGASRIAAFADPAAGGPVLAVGDGEVVHVASIGRDRTGAPVVNHEEQFRVGGSVLDLEPVARDGHALLGVLVDTSAISLLDVRRDPDEAAVARFTDPLRARDPEAPALLDLGAPPLPGILDGTSNTIMVAAARGTAEVHRYELPAGDAGALVLRSIEPVDVPVRQVVVGSLTLLPADGSGVAYSRRWTPAEGGLGTLWTIGGGTAELDPDRLAPASRGRWVTLRVEVADGRAAEIDPRTLHVVAGGRTIAAEQRPAPALVLADGDRNPELEVKLDRAALLDALAGRTGTVPLAVRWLQHDGTPGAAAAVARLG